ncbi:MAG: putative transglutaminase-like cysteine proteinase [Candidatus Endobugula sp.]|jgi:predicted transglutaminase-like cysteine proteinase
MLMFVAPWVAAVSNYRYISDKALIAIEKKYGVPASVRIAKWSEVLNKFAANKSIADDAMARFANDYFNQVRWEWDIKHWGVEDYWATPIETLGTYAGDCEDFSIGKYFSLTTMGMNTEKLRITYVKALELNLAHMVLAYYPYPGAEPLILDNINKTILPASQRKDLLPIYGFNGDGIWLAKSKKKLAAGASMSKSLPSWGKLNKRITKELL